MNAHDPSSPRASLDLAHDTTRPLGAEYRGNSTHFSLFATTARTCAVRLFDAELCALGDVPLAAHGDGLWSAELAGARPGMRYKFALDDRELPDPYARFLPHGVHGPALIVDPAFEFEHAGATRPLHEHVIYELHVGTFTEAGTYQAAAERLDYLVELGVTAIELMPLGAFAGSRGWGYDGVAAFAPFAPYGTPQQLKAFVDRAHGRGLAVLLDVVYNHFGPDGNYLQSYSPVYFTHEQGNAWGDAPNFAQREMRRLVLSNALYWLREFRFDGLRLDATHAISDRSATHILKELAQHAARLSPPRLLIAEDERNDPRLVTDFKLDAVWADDFHHALVVTLTREREGYYAAYEPGAATVARTIERGWLYEGAPYPPSGAPRGRAAGELPAEAFVYCIENHDQIGNRALGDRLSERISLEAYCAASTLLCFLPMTPLLFMGQEWAASSPFQYFTDHHAELGAAISRGRREEFKGFSAFRDPDMRARIPDPQARETFERSKLRWDELARADKRRVLDLYKRALALRASDPVLRAAGRRELWAWNVDDVLVVRRAFEGRERVLLLNFGAHDVPLTRLPQPSAAKLLLSSDGLALSSSLSPSRAIVLGN